jgi:predicted GNAT family acetyltransferase
VSLAGRGYAEDVLRTKARRAAPLRLLTERDRAEALALCEQDAAMNVFVSSRLELVPLEAGIFGAQIWGYRESGRLTSLCYAGANLVPVSATPAAVRAFAERARTEGRRCSSIVGPAEAVLDLWGQLAPFWGPAREVRAAQPVMAISGEPAAAPDPEVRQVRPDEIGILLPASVAMFTEEVGISPIGPDGGASYRHRVSELVSSGRAFARIDHGQVVFKAEIGAVSRRACQVQGVWVPPELRGRGIATAGMAAVVRASRRSFAPLVTLYVNDYNLPARAVYRRVGFAEVGTFASVLF